ncbi:MAG: hypothetical protein L0J49_01760, partial [Lactococcus lactis]|nr:hypothetical protein [Lactococcus lactis]
MLSQKRKYFFDNIEGLIRYIMEKREDIGQLRLQKTLYLLYAYYGATYGQLDTENGQDSEVEVDYPDELFDA